MSRGSPAWFLAVLALASVARADGLFVWKNEQIDIHEPEQKALIAFDEGVEDLVLSVKFEGAPEEFGWIVPLPSVPEMFPEDIDLFEELSRATQIPQFWRSERGFGLNRSLGMSDVAVIATETVGVYEATVVASGSGQALRDWLKEREFRLPQGSEGVFGRYSAQGWVFAALRIRPDSADTTQARRLASGTIQPIRFRFRCKEPVFPLEISSLSRRPSTILLYVLSPEALVPSEPLPERWESQVHSRVGHYWIDVYERLVTANRFLPAAEDSFSLTKHRALLSPEEMRDVHFRAYDPMKGLRSADEATRIEAITHVGVRKLGRYSKELVRILAHAKPGRETIVTLWALGQVGGLRAELALLGKAKDPNPETRLEAIEGLAAMRSRWALRVYVEGLNLRVAGRSSSWQTAAVQRACLDHLVEYGDVSCRYELRKLAAEEGTSQWASVGRDMRTWYFSGPRWSGDQECPGVLAVPALAASGDEDATLVLVNALVDGGRYTDEWTRRGGSCETFGDDTPQDVWAVRAARHGPDATRSTPWYVFQQLHNFLSADPAKRDRLYRRAVADPRLPDIGRVVLLANLSKLTDADVEKLLGIWATALGAPLTNNANDSHGRGRPSESFPVNVNAYSVIHALARHERLEELLQLERGAPMDDPELRGEIACVLATFDDSRAASIVEGHIRETWGKAVRAPTFEPALRRELERVKGSCAWLPPGLFDRSHRERTIAEALTRWAHQGDKAGIVRSLVTDRSVEPYVRLRVIGRCISVDTFAPVARAAIPDLQSLGGTPTLRAQVACMDEFVSRMETEFRKPKQERLREMYGRRL